MPIQLKRIAKITLTIITLVVVFMMGQLAKTWSDDRQLSNVSAKSAEVVSSIESKKITEAYNQGTDDFKEIITEDAFAKSVSSVSSGKVKVGELTELYQGYNDYLLQYNVVDSAGKPAGTLTIFIVNEANQLKFRDLYITN